MATTIIIDIIITSSSTTIIAISLTTINTSALLSLLLLQRLLLLLLLLRLLSLLLLLLLLRTPTASHRRPLESSNCGSICKTSADICEWWHPTATRESKGEAYFVAPYGRDSKREECFVAPCGRESRKSARGAVLNRNRRYLNTVRPVAIVPFQNAGSGAIYAPMCNRSYLKCSIPAMGGRKVGERGGASRV